MKTIMLFIADDGTQFDNQNDCGRYEKATSLGKALEKATKDCLYGKWSNRELAYWLVDNYHIAAKNGQV